jgi:hypothetical protein
MAFLGTGWNPIGEVLASSFKRRSQDVSGISVARRNLNGPKQKHLFVGAGGLLIENHPLVSGYLPNSINWLAGDEGGKSSSAS